MSPAIVISRHLDPNDVVSRIRATITAPKLVVRTLVEMITRLPAQGLTPPIDLDLIGHGSPGVIQLTTDHVMLDTDTISGMIRGLRRWFDVSSVVRLLGCETAGQSFYDDRDPILSLGAMARSLGCAVVGTQELLGESNFGPQGLRPETLLKDLVRVEPNGQLGSMTTIPRPGPGPSPNPTQRTPVPIDVGEQGGWRTVLTIVGAAAGTLGTYFDLTRREPTDDYLAAVDYAWHSPQLGRVEILAGGHLLRITRRPSMFPTTFPNPHTPRVAVFRRSLTAPSNQKLARVIRGA